MADGVYIELGKRIREARKEAGYTQEDLGNLLKMSDVGFGAFERGKRQISITYLIKVARFLGRSVDWFLGIETGLTDDEDELLTWWRNASKILK